MAKEAQGSSSNEELMAALAALGTRIRTLEAQELKPQAAVLAPVQVLAIQSALTACTGNAWTTVVFQSESRDSHDAYVAGTGIFTAPLPGLYHVQASVRFADSVIAAATNVGLAININTAVTYATYRAAAGTKFSINLNQTVELDAGDALKIQAQVYTAGSFNTSGDGDTLLSIVRTGVGVAAPSASANPERYRTSGRVLTHEGSVLAGVTITNSTASPERTYTTAAGGVWAESGLLAGAYTYTPTLAGYTFAPSSRSLTVGPDNNGGDFIATSTLPTTYTIRGFVRDQWGAAIAGATVGDGAGHTFLSASSGAYILTGLVAGDYTLQVTKADYTFAPTNLSVTVGPSATAKNFTGTAAAVGYAISGTILDGSGGAIAYVRVTAGAYSAYTDSSGAYSITNLAADVYNIVPIYSGYTFAPATREVTLPFGGFPFFDFSLGPDHSQYLALL